MPADSEYKHWSADLVFQELALLAESRKRFADLGNFVDRCRWHGEAYKGAERRERAGIIGGRADEGELGILRLRMSTPFCIDP